MQKLKLFLLIAFAAVSNSFAQCPNATFDLSDDTICGGDPVSFTNNSTGGSGYQWDFCTGDLLLSPTGTNYGGLGGLTYPFQNKAIIDGTEHYMFFVDNSNQLMRYDFGNSFNNAPTAFSYGNVGALLLANPQGLDIYNESGTWYALILNSGNNGAGPYHVIRVNLGTSITNTVVQADDLGTFTGFNFPITLKIISDGTSYYAFVTNYIGNSLTRLSFGSSLSNNTITETTFTDNALFSAYGLEVIHDCKNSKFVAYVTCKDILTVAVVDYGNSLSNAPVIAGSITVSSSPAALTAMHEGNNWYVLTVAQSATFSKLSVFNLGADPTNITPSAAFGDTVPGASIFLARYMCSVQDSSTSYCFVACADGPFVSKITFPQNCSSSLTYSTDQNPPPVLFSNGGMNYITLAVTNNNQVTYATDSVYVSSAPTVNFTFSPACLGQPVSFSDSSIISQGTVNGWQWDFGDLSSGSNLQNPTHVYTNDTAYVVTLTATSDAGCSASFSDTISVFDLPTANFNFVNNQCSETPVLFNDTSIPGAGDFIAGWEWNFGDNTPLDILQNPVHSFDTSGTFSVRLVVFGNSGCSDTITQSITIKPRPVISFTVSQTCIGETTLFSNGTTITDGSGLSYVWTFGDGSPASILINPPHPYPSIAATYTVQLIANSTNTCADTLLQNIRISTRANPGFILNPAAACLNNIVQFIDTSTIANGDSIVMSTWDFGDSVSGTGDTVTHIYTTSGTYNVTLTVTSWTSCDTSITKTITVLESPTANFTSTNVCMNAPMYFYDLSSTPVGSTIDSIIWDYGDGSLLDYGDTVIHGYSVADTFNVTQTVINNFGCSGTITQQVIVYALPGASFTTTIPACTGNGVSFNNTSSVQNDTITGNQWDFGDNSPISNLPNPVHIYNSTSTFSISLIVTSSHGCQATVTQPLTVYQSPTFTFTDSLFCLGDVTHFTYIPLQNPGSTWSWNFGDGDTAIIPAPTHQYGSAGGYNVTLLVSAGNGCSNSVSHLVTIYPKPLAGILSDSVICMGTIITFGDNSTISSGAISQWLWNFGDGSPLNFSQNTSHLYGNDTTYIVTHTVTSVAGCTDSASLSITIEPMPDASFIPDPTFGSPPLLVHFLNTSNNAIMYQWSFGDGGADPGTSPSHTYTDTGYYAVTLIATNAYNCSDTAHSNISVMIPYLDLGIKEVHATKLNDLLSLSADLANLGNTSISKFQISAKTENGSPINEQWQSDTLMKPGEFFTYNFAARYEIDPLNVPSFYCIEISQINDTTDAVESNNKKCSAINDLFELFEIFPNPANDNITIGMNVPLDGTVEVTIYNAIGQLIKLDAEVPVTKGHNEFNYSIRNFAKGFYACAVKYREEVKVRKIAKK